MRVLILTPVNHDGIHYDQDVQCDLNEVDAQLLIASGLAAPDGFASRLLGWLRRPQQPELLSRLDVPRRKRLGQSAGLVLQEPPHAEHAPIPGGVAVAPTDHSEVGSAGGSWSRFPQQELIEAAEVVDVKAVLQFAQEEVERPRELTIGISELETLASRYRTTGVDLL